MFLLSSAVALVLVAACVSDAEPSPKTKALADVIATPIATSTAPPPAVTTPSAASALRPDRGVAPSSRAGFVSLDDPDVLTAKETTFLSDDDLILGIESEGAARAYPVNMIFYHHIVNDTIGERPILITY